MCHLLLLDRLAPLQRRGLRRVVLLGFRRGRLPCLMYLKVVQKLEQSARTHPFRFFSATYVRWRGEDRDEVM